MTRLPHPGILTERERQNLEAVRYKNHTNLVRFKFNINDINRQIVVLPVGSIVRQLFPVYLEEGFNTGTGGIFLQLGILGTVDAFGIWPLYNSGFGELITGDMGTYMFKPITVRTPVIMTIKTIDLGTPPSTLRGWGLFEWLNLNLIPEV